MAEQQPQREGSASAQHERPAEAIEESLPGLASEVFDGVRDGAGRIGDLSADLAQEVDHAVGQEPATDPAAPT